MAMQSEERWRRRMEAKVDLLLRAAGLELQMEEDMTEATDALRQEVEALKAEDSEVHAAVQSAGEKFASLTEKLEAALKNPGGLTEEEVHALTNEIGEVGGHLKEAAAALNSEQPPA